MKEILWIVLLLGGVRCVSAQGTVDLYDCRQMAIDNNKKLKIEIGRAHV